MVIDSIHRGLHLSSGDCSSRRVLAGSQIASGRYVSILYFDSHITDMLISALCRLDSYARGQRVPRQCIIFVASAEYRSFGRRSFLEFRV